LPYYGKWIILLLITFLFSTCKQALPPEEGRKHLRAFDNEVIQLASRIGKTEAFRALIKLSEVSNPPIPYLNNSSADAYDFNASKGLYYVNSETGIFEKQADGTGVELVYPFDSKWDSLAIFTLTDYAETQTALQMIFPQKLEAKIVAGDKTLFTAHLSAAYKHDLPSKMDVEMIFSNFTIRMLLNTTFRRSHAEINVEFEFDENGENKLVASLTSDVNTVNNVLFYSNIDIFLEAFPIRLSYRSNQDFLNTEPGSFIKTFNRHTQIDISSSGGNHIGQVFLTQLQGRDRINPMIHYPDGSIENLEDMLFIIQKLLNMKMFKLDGLAGTPHYNYKSEARPSPMAFSIIE